MIFGIKIIYIEIGLALLIIFYIYSVYNDIYSRIYGEDRENREANFTIIRGIGLVVILIMILYLLITNQIPASQ